MPFIPAPQPCWLILSEGDWLGCGADWSKAVALAVRVWGEEIADGAQTAGPPEIRRADGLCVLLSCSGCGWWWRDEESGLPLHGWSIGDVLDGSADDGWMADLCPACQAAELMP